MFELNRIHNLHQLTDADQLFEKLRLSQCLCTTFQVGDYYWLNDASCEDGAWEYAVYKGINNSQYLKIESVTVSWCTDEKLMTYIRECLAGEWDNNPAWLHSEPVELNFNHGDSCRFCR